MHSNARHPLRRIDLFAGLPETSLDCIGQAGIERAYPAGSLILLEDAPCEAAYFIIEGAVSIYRLSLQGRQQILVRLGPGQSFNTVPPFQTEGRNAASAEAITDVSLFVIPKADFRALIRRCPDLAAVILHDFADRLAHLTGLAGDLSLHSVRARLARFLLNQTQSAEPARWTHEEIASHIGTVREVVSRTMRAFVKEGLLTVERQRITVADREALELEAKGAS